VRFVFTGEQALLRDMIRSSLKRDAGLDKTRRWTDQGDFREFEALARRSGWSGIGFPETIGGQGGGLIEQAILFEELGRSGAPSCALLAGTVALHLLRDCEAGRPTTSALLKGTRRGVVCISAGRGLDEASCDLEQRGGRLSGVVPFVLDAEAADELLVTQPQSEGLAILRVAKTNDGITIEGQRLIDRTRRFARVTFDKAPAERLGLVTRQAAAIACARAALLVAAESLGLARRMLDITVDYVKQRVQFGVPVGSFQAVKHSAAQALVEIEAAHSGVYHAAWSLEEGETDCALQGWIAKAAATETGALTADCALQLHGAIGYTWDYDLQLLYKRAKLNVELFGSPASYREKIAADLLASPLHGGRAR
jgi:alkylation response protein AidB-like acyl-CoA dehydrogenase